MTRTWTLPAAILFVALSARPAFASADLTVAVTAGTGWNTSSSMRLPTNLMISPGIKLLGDLLRVEVGLVADLPDVENSQFDFQVRPSAVLELPLLPIYGRLTAGVTQIVHGPVDVELGPSLGVHGHLGPLSIIGEAGYIPVVQNSTFTTIFEARAGVGVGF